MANKRKSGCLLRMSEMSGRVYAITSWVEVTETGIRAIRKHDVKSAARRIGLPLEDYIARVQAGEKFCSTDCHAKREAQRGVRFRSKPASHKEVFA